MLNLLLLLTAAQTQPAMPHALVGERCDFRQPQPIYTFFSPKNKVVALCRDGEIRWYDDPKRPPTKTAKIKEVPVLQLTAEQIKLRDEAIKMHQAMWGDIPWNFFENCNLEVIKGGAEFILHDRHQNVFFYSSETGELLRKVKLAFKSPIQFGSGTTDVSDDGKIFRLYTLFNYQTYIFNLDTGKELHSYPTPFIKTSSVLSPDGKTIFFQKDNVLSKMDALTGKPIGTSFTVPGVSSFGKMVVAPDNQTIAFSAYDLRGERAGCFILNTATNALTPVDPTLKKFATQAFLPNGKHLVLHEPKYLHFVNAQTGKHEFTYSAGLVDVWDLVGELSFSPDSSQLTFAPDYGVDIYMKFFIWCDLNQPRTRTQTKLGP